MGWHIKKLTGEVYDDDGRLIEVDGEDAPVAPAEATGIAFGHRECHRTSATADVPSPEEF